MKTFEDATAKLAALKDQRDRLLRDYEKCVCSGDDATYMKTQIFLIDAQIVEAEASIIR